MADRYSQNIMISSGKFDKERSYWEVKLKEKPPVSCIPYDFQKKNIVEGGRTVQTFDFPEEVGRRLVGVTKQSDYALFVFLLSGIKHLFSKYTGNHDVFLISPVFRQNKADADLFNTILPLRTDLKGRITFKEMLARVKQTVTDANAHQNFPVSLLLEDGDKGPEDGGMLNIHTAVLFENVHDAKYLEEIQVEVLISFKRTEDHIEMSIAYPESLYSGKKIVQIFKNLQNFFNQALSNPDAIVGDIEFLEPEEKEFLMQGFEGRAKVFSESYGQRETGLLEILTNRPGIRHIEDSELKVFILDEEQRHQSTGFSGEIYIIGEKALLEDYLAKAGLSSKSIAPHSSMPGCYMYAAGKIGRVNTEGKLEYIGRPDQQVYADGELMNLRQVELALLSLKGIEQVSVMKLISEDGINGICAYIVSSSEIKEQEIQSFLEEKIAEGLKPHFIITVESIPVKDNGSIWKDKLPEPPWEELTSDEPANEMERKLVQIWREILGVQKIGVKDDFFDLGGNSLIGVNLSSRILKEFQVDVPLGEIFKGLTVRILSKYIENAGKSIYSSIQPVKKASYYPVSSAQRRLFVLSKLEDSGTSYNISGAVIIEGELGKERIEEAFKGLIKKHEAFRTTFEMVDGQPVQRIWESAEFSLGYLEKTDASIPEAERISMAARDFVKTFDLKKAPLLRGQMVKLGENRYILLFDMHHIISDGVSTSILVKEFAALLEGRELPPLRLQYKDFAVWQNELIQSGAMGKQEEYWLNVMKGELPVLNMPLDYQRPSVQSFEGGMIVSEIGETLTDKLKKLAAETSSSLYMVLLAAYNILLSKYTGQEDIIVGTPVAGRPHADLSNIIGMFVNTLAVRNQPNGDMTFEAFLNSVRNNTLSAFENGDYQFEKLIEKLDLDRDMSRNPLFDTIFNLQNFDTRMVQVDNLKFIPYEIGKTQVKIDLLFSGIEEEGNLSFNIDFCTKLFKKDTIKRMAEHYKRILEQITEDPCIRLEDIELITDIEKNKILHDFNATKADYPQHETLQGLFEKQAAENPGSIAVISGDKALTYGEFNGRVNQLSRLLRQKGIGRDSVVGIICERSAEMIVGIYSVIKAGGAYLPISPEYPIQRIEYMINNSGAKLVLAQSSLIGKLQLPVEMLGLDNGDLYTGETSNIENINTPGDMAYIIYTSGSTGNPKGVMIEHGSVINRLNWMQKKYPIGPADVILQKTPFTFDVSVWELFWWSLNGARVSMLVPGGEKDPGAIIEETLRSGITTMHFVPSMLNIFLDYVEKKSAEGKLRSLRQVFASGEALMPQQVEKFNRLVSATTGAGLHNLYGPTEATVDVSFYDCPASGVLHTVPIGKPIDNTGLYVVDKKMKILPVGIPGELYISGVGLARGYVGNDALTREKFVESPADGIGRIYKTGDLVRWAQDGNIEYLGRIDNQVKIRGFRIEPGEIERRLMQFEGIEDCVVIALEDHTKSKYLAAYYVAGEDFSVSSLRAHVASELPEYMVPAYFMKIDKIPLSQNGKLDRKQLPSPENIELTSGTVYREPVTDIEKVLAGAWKEVLKKDRIGADDNFFEIGGNSLLLVVMQGKLDELYPGKVEIADIFANPTISRLAVFINESGQRRNVDISSLEIRIDESFFVKDGQSGGDGQSLTYRLEDGEYRSLLNIAAESKVQKEQVLITLFSYMLHEVSSKEQITVLSDIDDAGSINPVLIDFSKNADLYELIGQAGGQTGNAKYDYKDLQQVNYTGTSKFTIIPFFAKKCGGDIKVPSACSISLKSIDENNCIRLVFDYNPDVIDGSRAHAFMSDYIGLISGVLNN